MSVFLCKLGTLFCLKTQKNAVLALCSEISIAKVRLRFNLVRKCRSAIVKLRCASTESKSLLRKLRCASEMKKIQSRILRCAFTRWKDRCVLLRCASGIMLFVDTSAKKLHRSLCSGRRNANMLLFNLLVVVLLTNEHSRFTKNIVLKN